MRLNRDQVLSTALDLLDEVGLDLLTMRRLTTTLGVQTAPPTGTSAANKPCWRPWPTPCSPACPTTSTNGNRGTSGSPSSRQRLRRALLSRRDGARLFAGAFFPLPNALAYGETMIATLRAGGLPSRDASWAADTLTYYVVGHTIEEQLAAGLPDGGATAAARLAEAVDPQRHPHMCAALAHIPAPHHEQHFDYGLHLVVRRHPQRQNNGTSAETNEAEGSTFTRCKTSRLSAPPNPGPRSPASR